MSARKRNARRSAPKATSGWLPRLHWRVVLYSGGGLMLAAAALAGLMWLLDQPIERVTITGRLQRVSPLAVERVVRADLHGAGLVRVGLDRIVRDLETLPWVDRAAVQRSWPRGLAVEITEQVAVARWNDAGLLNARGELFVSDARFVPPELPQLLGPPGSEHEVATRYLTMQGRLTEQGLRLVSLSLDARGAWHFALDDGVSVRLGRLQPDERFERFMLAAAKLVHARAGDIAYVDMRYGNGFAVGWKGAATRPAAAGGNAHTNG
jgi:cell division protein FtsQ